MTQESINGLGSLCLRNREKVQCIEDSSGTEGCI